MTYEEFCTRFQIQLNEQQTEAVHSVKGPVLLLAVPGSGKTTVLITRLGYMIYCVGIAPQQIMTLTYTIAATNDMAARFRSYFGEELGGRLEFRTINGVCARIIQYYGRLIGKSSFALVTDEKLTTGMLSAIYQKVEGDYAVGSDIKNIRTLITYIKNRMLTGEEIRRLDETCGFRISEIHNAYCAGLRSQGLMDYDDQMIYAHTILRKSPETLQYFRDRYPYICVDEAQDTSKIQHEIIRLLAGEQNQLFMVGDEDQSIYGFRAAYPKALMSFEQNYPGAKVLLMEENFRSNARIVEAANQFIQKNTMRHQKHMRAARPKGAEIREIDLKGNIQNHPVCEKGQFRIADTIMNLLPIQQIHQRQDAFVVPVQHCGLSPASIPTFSRYRYWALPVHPEQAQEKASIPTSTIKPVYGDIVKKKAFSREAFSEFCLALGEGLLVRHKKFGEGVIVKMEESRVVIRFKEQERRFELRILFENDLLEYH